MCFSCRRAKKWEELPWFLPRDKIILFLSSCGCRRFLVCCFLEDLYKPQEPRNWKVCFNLGTKSHLLWKLPFILVSSYSQKKNFYTKALDLFPWFDLKTLKAAENGVNEMTFRNFAAWLSQMCYPKKEKRIFCEFD